MRTSCRTRARNALRSVWLASIASAIALLAPAATRAATIAVTTTADEFNSNPAACSLREAIWAANRDLVLQAGCTAGSGTDEITVPAGTYNLTIPGAGEQGDATGDLDVSGPATIRHIGAGPAIVDAKGIDRVFEINTPGGAAVTISGLTIQGGNAAAVTSGAGILNTAGVLNLSDSTVANNTASSFGGGIESSPGAISNIVNTTVSGNSANGDGGGIDNTGATTTLLNATITGNTTDAEGNGFGQGGGVGQFGGTTTMHDTLVAGNVDRGGQSPDCTQATGTLVSQGQTLIGNLAGCAYTAALGDITGVDAKLGPLAENGGPTPTHALLTGSPALNKGAGCARDDQRGVPRAAGGACDIGAYELVRCRGRIVNYVGTNGRDVLTGTAAPDAFLLLGGTDTAFGLGGSDVFCGAGGKDKEVGGPGRDLLHGDTGKDKLIGDGGDDLLAGGDGADKLLGGGGKDDLRGNGSEDRCNGGAGKHDKASGCERTKKIP
ncbi:MAG: calcium-binding protein [Actinomycetota bacterium]